MIVTSIKYNKIITMIQDDDSFVRVSSHKIGELSTLLSTLEAFKMVVQGERRLYKAFKVILNTGFEMEDIILTKLGEDEYKIFATK